MIMECKKSKVCHVKSFFLSMPISAALPKYKLQHRREPGFLKGEQNWSESSIGSWCLLLRAGILMKVSAIDKSDLKNKSLSAG